MATRMQQRRGTAATWTAANPILAAGEIGFEIDTNKFKIGDGSNRWANLTYFTADAAAAIQNLIDGAPGVLDTLNELAAALGDDPSFFTTVATNLSNHESDTTNIHGIADTSLLATKSYADQAEADAISTASADATTKANNAKAGAEATAAAALSAAVSNLEDYADTAEADAISTAAADATSKANAAQSAAISAAAADATSKANAAQSAAISAAAADATSKANAAQAAAEATAAAALSAAVSNLEDYADTAEADAKSYTDQKISDLIDGAPAALDTLNEIAASLGDDANYAATITNALALKAPLASPTFTGTVSGITKSMVGLGDVDNTSDVNKPVSTAQAAADTAVANAAAADATSKANAAQAAAIAAAAADATTKADAAEADAKSYTDAEIADLDSSVTSALALKAPLASPTFTGTVSGISKSMVGLGNVDNTSDVNKPISTATQSALDLKAPLASPTFTGTVSGISKSMVGLGNVDNTSDINKPLSTATSDALALKANLASPTLTGAPTAPTAVLGTNTTQIATTAFVDAAIEALASRNLVLDGGGV